MLRAGTDQNPNGLNVARTVAMLFLILAIGWIFALGVAALVYFEAAFPTGTLRSFSQIFTGWEARRRRARRYAFVPSIAVRHGLGARLRGVGHDDGFAQDAKIAQALRNALNKAGVAFIKMGPMLSTGVDLLPGVYIRELEYCKPKLPLLNRLPRLINKISEDLEQGRFSMNVRVLGHSLDRSFLTGLFQQLIVMLVFRNGTDD